MIKTMDDLEKSILKMKRTISKKELENENLRKEVACLRNDLRNVKKDYVDHFKSTAELREAVDRLSAEKSKWLRRKDT